MGNSMSLTAEQLHEWRLAMNYSVWMGMKSRCYSSKSTAYPHYGARGIVVCNRWHQFENFLADLGVKPGPEYAFGRIDHDGNYEPGNVEWQLVSENARESNSRPRRTLD